MVCQWGSGENIESRFEERGGAREVISRFQMQRDGKKEERMDTNALRLPPCGSPGGGGSLSAILELESRVVGGRQPLEVVMEERGELSWARVVGVSSREAVQAAKQQADQVARGSAKEGRNEIGRTTQA